LPPLRYDTNEKQTRFFKQLLEQIGLLPGVSSAAAGMSLPMTAFAGTPVQDAAKPPLRLNERLIAKFIPITMGYFHTLEIPFRSGRDFSERDTADAPRVAIIDEAMARHFWPSYPQGQNPIGQRLLVGGVNPKPAEIVGVVADVHQNLDNREDWKESVYVAFAQSPNTFTSLAVRTNGDPLSFAKAVRQEVRALDQEQGLSDVETMESLVERQVGQRKLLVILLGAFAGMSLLLALIGIYGVIAYSVAQRRQEVGIRRALGAQSSDILGLILGQGMNLALIGIAVGIAGAFGLRRVMSTLLFHVSATDPKTFLGIAALYFFVALGACYVPARRAMRIDPMAALRL
jgi:predicted permease